MNGTTPVPSPRVRSTQATAAPFTPRTFDPHAPMPLHRQLYDALRTAILHGRLRAGARLPSTRALAAELGLSRTTVLAAIGQLRAEGYVEAKQGSRTFVAHVLPDDILHATSAPTSPTGSTQPNGRPLSRRGQLLLATPIDVAREVGAPRAFRPGVPALDLFPWKAWVNLEARHLRRASGSLRAYGNPAGYAPLRQAIADYLGAARAVRCDPCQVIIVAGAQQGLDLVARVLLDPGDAVWVEDPGYVAAKAAFVVAGARLAPVPVDAEGLDVAAGVARCPDARLAYVSPSHQYPLGVTMSLARRLALLRRAADAGMWVVEDDYDSEFRYAGRPLAALQGLDEGGRVLYIGTFSKVLSPALRLGYLVVPPDLVDAFARARTLVDRGSPLLGQAVLADFLVEGHAGRHIRRMRALYAERQAALVSEARRQLAGGLAVPAQECGLHLVGWLPAGRDDRALAAAAVQRGVEAPPLAAFSAEPPRVPGLVLGYAPYDEGQIREGIARLALALERSCPLSTSTAG